MMEVLPPNLACCVSFSSVTSSISLNVHVLCVLVFYSGTSECSVASIESIAAQTINVRE